MSLPISVMTSESNNHLGIVSTEKHLISLTKLFISLLNARMYDHAFIRSHMSPSISVNMNGNIYPGLEAFIHNYKVVADESPEFHTAICNESALVDEVRGVGSVLLSQDMSAHGAEGRRMAGTIAYYWRREAGVWVCESCSMMYGTPEFLAGDGG